MRFLAAFALRHRVPIIIAFVAVTAFFAFWIKDLRVNSDLVSYLPKEDAAVQLFNHLGEKFRQNDLVPVAVETDDVFSTSTLAEIDRLTQAFKSVEGISSVLSLADMMDIHKAVDGGIEIGRLFERECAGDFRNSSKPCGRRSWAASATVGASCPPTPESP